MEISREEFRRAAAKAAAEEIQVFISSTADKKDVNDEVLRAMKIFGIAILSNAMARLSTELYGEEEED